jgi:hypothetical protein
MLVYPEQCNRECADWGCHTAVLSPKKGLVVVVIHDYDAWMGLRAYRGHEVIIHIHDGRWAMGRAMADAWSLC